MQCADTQTGGKKTTESKLLLYALTATKSGKFQKQLFYSIICRNRSQSQNPTIHCPVWHAKCFRILMEIIGWIKWTMHRLQSTVWILATQRGLLLNSFSVQILGAWYICVSSYIWIWAATVFILMLRWVKMKHLLSIALCHSPYYENIHVLRMLYGAKWVIQILNRLWIRFDRSHLVILNRQSNCM